MKVELRKLERELAYSTARSDIECQLTSEYFLGVINEPWFRRSSMLPEDEEFVGKALRYLELRKLLAVHPNDPDLVRPLNEKGGAL